MLLYWQGGDYFLLLLLLLLLLQDDKKIAPVVYPLKALKMFLNGKLRNSCCPEGDSFKGAFRQVSKQSCQCWPLRFR